MADVEKGNGAGNAAGYAGGGQFRGATSFTPRATPIGNPGALGLFSFAGTTFLLSLYNVNARGITTPNVVLGMAIFTGGLAQLLAGMWEFPRGNQFGATAFTSYGAFWMSYAMILIPGTGVTAAYSSVAELDNAIGLFLMVWMIFTFMMLLGSLRKNFTFIALFFFLTLTFMMLGIGSLTASTASTKAGGALGLITAIIAYYAGISELFIYEHSYFIPPLGEIAKRA